VSRPVSGPNQTASPRRAATLFHAALWSIALSGLGLYLFARETMNPAVATLVAWHILGGIALGIPYLLGKSFARRSFYGLFVMLCGLTGIGLAAHAALGGSIGHAQAVFLAHVITGVGVTVIAGWSVAASRLRRRAAGRAGSLPASTVVAATLLALSTAAFAAYTYAAEAYYQTLTATNAQQAGNPLFPAGTLVAVGASWASTPSAQSCGTQGCHSDIVTQWQASGHAHAGSNPVYQATLASSGKSLKAEGAKWCQGCHGPTDLLTEKPDYNLPGNVDCLSCHAMAHVPDTTGNGRALYAAPQAYPFADSQQSSGKWMHGFLLRVRPAPHMASLSGPKGGNSRDEMCAPCHRLSVNVAQNHYKFLRYDDTWSDWQKSPFSQESLHTFATVPVKRSCTDCHFSAGAQEQTIGATHNHACPITPGTNGQFSKDKDLRVEIFALHMEGVGKPGLNVLVAPLSGSQVSVAPGTTVTVDVLVENRGIGHAFPSGVPDLRDAWLSFTVSDPQGRVLMASTSDNASLPYPTSPGPSFARRGDAGSRRFPPLTKGRARVGFSSGDVHRYGLLALDRSGQPVDHGNIQDMVAPVYSHSIGAGEGDVARYQLTIPAAASGTLRLTAQLHYRRFKPAFLEKLRFDERRTTNDQRRRPNDPTTQRPNTELETRNSEPETSTVLAEHSVDIFVGTGAQNRVVSDVRNAPRLFAYGAALLNQRDLAASRAAFQEAVRLSPRNAEYLIGLARANLADGDLLSARNQLEKALQLEHNSPRAQAWLGTTLRLMGQFEASLGLLTPLAERYPSDRQLWMDIGLCYLQSGKNDEAAQAFTSLLAIDPDDASAHYNLMQSYLRTKKISLARREEAIFRALQDDEPLRSLKDPYLKAHPQDGVEAQLIHQHRLIAIDPGSKQQ
jgi:tetratricopeptide (TPR) repeat protein